MMARVDVIVIGGGVMGLAVTYYLARRGSRVVLLERDDIASGTAGASDGVVSYHTKKPGEQMQLAMRSIAMFEDLSRQLGEDMEFTPGCGGMLVAEDEMQWLMLEKISRQQREGGADVRMIRTDEMRQLEPMLAKDLYGALYTSTGAKIEPIRLTMALLHAAKRLGAVVLNDDEVVEVTLDASGAFTGATTLSGQTFEANTAVLACGCWSDQAARMFGITLPVKPRRGQLLMTEPVGYFMHCTLQCARYNLIKYMPETITDAEILRLGAALSIHQTPDGGILIGGTREWVDFDRAATSDAMEAIAKRAIRFFPSLESVHIVRSFAGLRPYTPDGLPLIGPTKHVKGLYIATGHEGDGIAMAPITGSLISEMILDGRSSVQVEAFQPDRFDLKV